MRDARRAPFCFQTATATTALRRRWQGKERTTAVAIYQAMTELANEARSDSFSVARARLADYAGTSDRTIDKYAEAFVDMGLLTVERRRLSTGGSLTNVWTLVEPSVPQSGDEASSRGGEASSPRGGEASRTPNQEHVGGEQQTLADLGGSQTTSSGDNAGSGSKTPHSELHEGCARRGGVCDCGKRACAVDLRDAWSHWLSLASPRNAEPTPSQTKMLERALRESSLDLVKESMVGLVEWRKQRGGDLSLSRIFKTRPGGDSLTDQIEWWAGQSGGPGGAHGFTSDALAKIARLKDHVRRDVDRGEALNRLSEEYGMVAIPPQGEREPWKFEVRRG